MAHHGWIPVLNPLVLTPDGLRSPFGRLFAAEDHQYNSHAISMFAGPMGPLQELANPPPPGPGAKAGNPAGFTFLGQFVDHDLTEFRVIGEDFKLIPQNPVIGQRQKVLQDLPRPDSGPREFPTTTNGRTGKLDLDSVYGLLGGAQPDLFDTDGLFIHSADSGNPAMPDIMRGDQYRNKRLIADPRNDENKLIVQIHLLFERLHNKLHAAKPAGPGKVPTGADFLETQTTVRAIYRNIILLDYLPRIVDPATIELILGHFADGTTLFQRMNRINDELLLLMGLDEDATDESVAIPVEFSHAAFRLGHTQLRNGYELRTNTKVPLFNTTQNGRDLRGDQHLFTSGANGFDFHIDWALFFQTSSTPPNHGEPIDGRMPPSIFRLPPPSIGEPPQSLPERNIRRAIDFGLPTGQSAATQLSKAYKTAIQPMSNAQLFPPALFNEFTEILSPTVGAPSLQWETPLWYYIIQEAAQVTGTAHLGSVGGFIVGETILGALLEAESAAKGEARQQEIRDLAAQKLAFFQNISPPGDEAASGHPLAWDKAINTVDQIYTMGQLVKWL